MTQIEGPKTIEDFEAVRRTILNMMGGPYCDHLMFMSLSHRLEQTEEKIQGLKEITNE